MDNIIQMLLANRPLLYVIIAWAVIWKGIALWYAARGRQLAWYIALLIINTVGIFEIIYLVFFRKKDSIW